MPKTGLETRLTVLLSASFLIVPLAFPIAGLAKQKFGTTAEPQLSGNESDPSSARQVQSQASVESSNPERISFRYSGFFVSSLETAHHRSRYSHGQLALDTKKIAVTKNLGIELAPDHDTARALEDSLNAFLTEAVNGKFSEKYVNANHLKQNEFFFSNLKNIQSSRRAGVSFSQPSILKAFSFDGKAIYITLSVCGKANQQPFVHKIFELKALRTEKHFRFECLFDERTKRLKSKKIKNIIFHFESNLDVTKAEAFVQFRNKFCKLTRATSRPMHYYKFASLESALKAYGILYDCTKCNDLSNDLGMCDDNGNRFVTGMANECNIHDYVYGHFTHYVPNRDEIYRPIEEGIAVYYGNTWGGVTLEEMKRRFKKAFDANPKMNFLEEFKKGRKAHVGPHFTSYFICSLFCKEAIEKHGFDAALKLLYSGEEGERFFAGLKDVLEINESNFHQTVVRLLSE